MSTFVSRLGSLILLGVSCLHAGAQELAGAVRVSGRQVEVRLWHKDDGRPAAGVNVRLLLSFLVSPEAASLTGLLIQAFSRGGEAFLRRAQHRWFQFLFHCYERCTIPGLALHQAVRKRHIERVVCTSLEEGFEQVVVLGGGLDTLALRLHKQFPKTNFLELDHPATQRIKREVIESGHLASANLRLIPVDFAQQNLEDCLTVNTAYIPGTKTVFLCEALLMNLASAEVTRLFA